MNKHPKSQWTCNSCGHKYLYGIKKPSQTLKACVWYGDKGRPPFSKPYNDSILKAIINYCENC